MKDAFREYILDLGLGGPALERCSRVLAFYDGVGLNAEDIFISEYREANNNRVYESMLVFTKSHIAEAHQFLTSDIYDMTAIGKMFYWKVSRSDYEGRAAGEAARLSVTVQFENNLSCNMKASGHNCDFLRDIFNKYFASKVQ
ncbi:MAG TPA: hypothetical protein VGT99_11195 [Gammaproteobacteria bacterium]|nr:hypothetical protein [Gammaproteobacteria bacterium]